MNKLLLLVILIILTLNISALNPTKYYEEFFTSFLSDPNSIQNYLPEETIYAANVLGITYDINYPKFLIGNIPTENIRKILLNDPDKYQLTINDLGEGYSHLEVSIIHGKLNYFFKNLQLISEADYSTRNWQTQESEFFRFRFPTGNPPDLIAVKQLDDFAKLTLNTLTCSLSKVEQLKEEKINYLFCPDEDTIDLVTGFRTRGICLLNQDYVVSRFPAHFHEVSHMLINYRIQENQLFTHPFLLEGFAVAMGGRGGKTAEIILNIGLFLQNSGFANYEELLSLEGFIQMDASISYPVAGLYNCFLMNNLDFDSYLNLYRKYGNDNGNFNSIQITELPLKSDWEKFLINADFQTIALNNKTNYSSILNTDSLKVGQSKEYFEFHTKSPIKIDFEAGKFQLTVSGRFKITCNENEVNILDTATGNLVATYVNGFTLENQPVEKQNGLWHFFVKRSVFE
ncbi:MAG: hypothetical protein P9L95_08040 [Candidatus Tenebribacter mawsonii]|nr:hypothetical protein [Candidatus Tenebribacter mawsonii]